MQNALKDPDWSQPAAIELNDVISKTMIQVSKEQAMQDIENGVASLSFART
jgi:hypothetical protein